MAAKPWLRARDREATDLTAHEVVAEGALVAQRRVNGLDDVVGMTGFDRVDVKTSVGRVILRKCLADPFHIRFAIILADLPVEGKCAQSGQGLFNLERACITRKLANGDVVATEIMRAQAEYGVLVEHGLLYQRDRGLIDRARESAFGT